MKSLLKFITSKHQLEALKLIEEKDAAKKFQKALIKFAKHAPEIDKNEVGELKDKTKFAYAMLDNIQRKIKKPLIKSGLRYKFTQTATNNAVKVACIVSHTAGHKERTDLTININHDDNLTVEQQTGAATSYAKRYCLVNALGLIINGDDSEAFNDMPDFEAGKPVSKNDQKGDYLERERAKAEKEYKDKVEAIKAENEAFRATIPRLADKEPVFQKEIEVTDLDDDIEKLEANWTKEAAKNDKAQSKPAKAKQAKSKAAKAKKIKASDDKGSKSGSEVVDEKKANDSDVTFITVKYDHPPEPVSRIISEGKYCAVLENKRELNAIVNNQDITVTEICEDGREIFVTFDAEDQAMVTHKEERRLPVIMNSIKELAEALNVEIDMADYGAYCRAVNLFGFTEEELIQAYHNSRVFVRGEGKGIRITPHLIFKSYQTIKAHLNLKSKSEQN